MKVFKLTVKEEFIDECKGYIVAHTEHCKTEPGNTVSSCFQDTEDPRFFYIFSDWKDRASEEQHEQSPSDAAFVAKMQGKEECPGQMIQMVQLA